MHLPTTTLFLLERQKEGADFLPPSAPLPKNHGNGVGGGDWESCSPVWRKDHHPLNSSTLCFFRTSQSWEKLGLQPSHLAHFEKASGGKEGDSDPPP